MIKPYERALKYYREQGILTDLGKHKQSAQVLPSGIAELSEVVQGIILHDMWTDKYNVTPKPEQRCSVLTPSMENLLDVVVGIDGSSPFSNREPGERVIACCREFSTMLCSILRAKGIPARARCGFAPYLAKEGNYEDHWICEAWNGVSWQRIDPQIDTVQLKSFHDYAKKHDELGKKYRNMLLNFDPLSLKPTDFILAGEAWLKCRNKELDPDKFGLDVDLSRFNIKTSFGLWFIRGNLVRDLLALNKVELLPFVEGLEYSKVYWDDWPIMQPTTSISIKDMALFDEMANLVLDPDKNLDLIQLLYASRSVLHPPESILPKL